MKNLSTHLNPDQYDRLRSLVASIGQLFKPEKIYCYGYRLRSFQGYSTFVPEQHQQNCDIDLLVLTAGTGTSEEDMQLYVNEHYDNGAVSILCHPAVALNTLIRINNRFFTNLIQYAVLLYGTSESIELPAIQQSEQQKLGQECSKDFGRRLNRMRGFLAAGRKRLDSGDYTLAVFMLQHALVQACTGLIYLYLGLHIESSNLAKLIRLCNNFHPELSVILPGPQGKETRLFYVLCDSYTDARMEMAFNVSGKYAVKLFRRGGRFLRVAEKLGRDRILKQAEQECLQF